MGMMDSDLDNAVFSVSLDGGPDDEAGSITEAPGTWAGVMRDGAGIADAIQNDPEIHGHLKADDLQFLREEARAGVIIFTDSNGFNYMQYYAVPEDLERDWQMTLEDLDIPDEDEGELEQNPRRQPAGESEARELVLYIENTANLFGPRSQADAIRKNLLRKMRAGKYDSKLAEKAWLHLATAGAMQYSKEHGDARDWSRVFTPATRELVAASLSDSFESEAKLGNYDYLLEQTKNSNRDPWKEVSFSVGIYDQSLIEDNARDKIEPEAVAEGYLSSNGEITQKGWDQLNQDVQRLERNAMRWLRMTFAGARDDGHDAHDDLVGEIWFDPSNQEQSELVELGLRERIDMVDSSYGDLTNSVWDGVSEFGVSILGGAINFHQFDS